MSRLFGVPLPSLIGSSPLAIKDEEKRKRNGKRTIFETPSITPKLPVEPPDSLPLHEFLFGDAGETSRWQSRSKFRPLFTCGISGVSYSVAQVTKRFEALARTPAADLQWNVNGAHDEMDRVVAFYAVNKVRL